MSYFTVWCGKLSRHLLYTQLFIVTWPAAFIPILQVGTEEARELGKGQVAAETHSLLLKIRTRSEPWWAAEGAGFVPAEQRDPPL